MCGKYRSRILDEELKRNLETMGAVLIIGPKGCGKTTTAKQFAKSVLELHDSDNMESYLMWADIKPSNLLIGEKPRLIDDWQIAPVVWDSVRTDVDNTSKKGLYILTGHNAVDESKIMHSGIGRIHRLLMRPMSLFESGDSNGKISLMELFDNPDLNIDGIESGLSMDDLIFSVCRGGWPEFIDADEDMLQIPYKYLKNICCLDMSAIDDINRNPDKVKAILQSIARNNNRLCKNSKILEDIKKNYGYISGPTFYSYVDALKRLFVIEDIPGWAPGIKSKNSMRKTNKKVFIDPSIAIAALNLNSDSFNSIGELKTFGVMFENLCIRDLSVYSGPLGGKISYYQDNNGTEVDCVVHLRDGRYALIECKLGRSNIEKGCQNLLKVNKLIEKSNEVRNPEFLAILTGGEAAYTRPDGIKIIPIGCLR